MTDKELIMEARMAMERAYAPYSHHKVGAALLTRDGKVYHGCNIENAAYGPSNCAERTAFFKAVYEGERDFDRIAVVGGMEGTDGFSACAPCGVCRQVMMEFCDPKIFKIVLADGPDRQLVFTLKDLMPLGFGPDNLGGSL